MAFVTANGVQLEYLDQGAGAHTWVFIHGWGCDYRAWGPQIDDLSKSFRCVAPNLRGRGGSDARGPYDLETQADDVAALILELGAEPAIVCGHSQGGNIALLLNQRHPELVEGVVLCDAPVGPDPMRDWSATRDELARAPEGDAAAPFVEGMLPADGPADLGHLIREMMSCVPLDVGMGWLEPVAGLSEQNATALVKAADAKPFMAIWAQSPMGDIMWLRDVATFLRHELLPDTGHFVQLERPEVTSALLRAFVDDVERDPRVVSR
ncbi:MAG TPA: alpha/beta hydrolase [Tepidiformaceae bacterium]|nr:alpha/beta hydrolase [Tepidiformaceae bacterium]